MSMDEKVTLTELQGLIRDRIYEALPDRYWVIAEIAELKVNSSGHCYLELTGSDKPGGKITSRARATIWSAKYNSLNTYFTASTGIPIRQGITILFRATVEYHELYGLSLNITDIDPSYTAGDMALRREAIIRRLNEEGVIEMNRELSMPYYPRNIAVISSHGAAGYRDFVNQLATNVYGYVFVPQLYEAIMQGNETEQSVIGALNSVMENISATDVVVIIRGGGSATDLAWFDSYDIAYHVTQIPVPVLTGIGHDKDRTITDMVACRSLKTPTAVASFLIDSTADTESHIAELAGSLADNAEEVISSAEERLSSAQNRIMAGTRLAIKLNDEKLQFQSGRLTRAYTTVLRGGKELAETLETRLTYLNPQSVLKRGYTISTKDGKIIRSAAGLSPGDTLSTIFADGETESKVETTKGKGKNG